MSRFRIGRRAARADLLAAIGVVAFGVAAGTTAPRAHAGAPLRDEPVRWDALDCGSIEKPKKRDPSPRYDQFEETVVRPIGWSICRSCWRRPSPWTARCRSPWPSTTPGWNARSGQTAWLNVTVDGQERISPLMADGALVSTAQGSPSYARAMGAQPLPMNTPALLWVGSNVLRPAFWRPVVLPLDAHVELGTLDPVKRPLRGYVDGVDQGPVKSTRGPHGGYALARTPGEISFLDVIEAVEGPVTVNLCTDAHAAGDHRGCAFTDRCTMMGVWQLGQQKMLEVYAATKLDRLAMRSLKLESPVLSRPRPVAPV